MKQHIVFILSDYLPLPSANGLCANKVIDVLKENHQITVISTRNHSGLPEFENYNSQNIIRIEAWEHYARNKIADKIGNSKRLKRIYYLTLLRLVQLRRYAHAILSKENVKRSYVNEYVKALKKINEPIDIIVPVCFPFESVVAALRFKEKYNTKVHVVPYLFDKFSVSSTLHRTDWNKTLKMERHLELEKQMFEKSDKIIASKDWMDHIKTHFSQYKKKIRVSDVPSLSKIYSNKASEYDKNKINLVYTGALNQKIRSPKYTLELFSSLMGDRKDVILHFYIRGNCNNIVNDFVNNNEHQIINHGSVSIDIAHSALNSANILVSIGNTDITQRPSKIYEYMASGKPIIHLYHDKKDPVLNILSKYPMSCCIEQTKGKTEHNKLIVIDFINKYKNGQSVNFDEVKRRFYDATPEYAADIIIDHLIE